VKIDSFVPEWEENLKKLDRWIELYTPCCAVEKFDGQTVCCELVKEEHTLTTPHQSSKTYLGQKESPNCLTPRPCNWEGQFVAPDVMFPKVHQVALMEFDDLATDWMENYRVKRLELLKNLHQYVELESGCLGCFKEAEKDSHAGATCMHTFCKDCWADIHEAAKQKNNPPSCPCCGTLLK